MIVEMTRKEFSDQTNTVSVWYLAISNKKQPSFSNSTVSHFSFTKTNLNALIFPLKQVFRILFYGFVAIDFISLNIIITI